MIAVIYDPETGIITNTIQGSEELIAQNGSYVEVQQWRFDYDSKYLVNNGEVVLKTPEEIAATEPARPPVTTTVENYDPYA